MKSFLAFLLFLLVNSEILQFDEETSQLIFLRKNAALILFIQNPKNQKSISAYQALQKYDHTNPDIILSVCIKNKANGLFQRYTGYLGIDVISMPMFIMRNEKGQNFRYLYGKNSDINLSDFVAKVFSGYILPSIISEPAPTSNNNPVKVTVGDNFNEIVLKTYKQVIVLFYAPWCEVCNSIIFQYQQIAKSLVSNKNLVFATINTHKNQVPGVQITGYPSIKFWKKNKKYAPLAYTGKIVDLTKWLKQKTEYPWMAVSSSSQILDFNDQAMIKIFQQKNTALFLIVNDLENKQALNAHKAFLNYDKTNPDIILCLVNKRDGNQMSKHLADFFNVDITQKPAIILRTGNNDKFIYDAQTFSAQTLVDFVARVNSGEVTPYIISQPIPQKNDKPVKVAVAYTFNQMVLQTQKEVLVKFHIPWCPKCKQIAPHYEQAAKRLLNNPNIMLVELQWAKNEVYGVVVKSTPTLKFWKKDKTMKPIDFDGQRNADGIIEWIKDHTQYPWVEEIGSSQSGNDL